MKLINRVFLFGLMLLAGCVSTPKMFDGGVAEALPVGVNIELMDRKLEKGIVLSRYNFITSASPRALSFYVENKSKGEVGLYVRPVWTDASGRYIETAYNMDIYIKLGRGKKKSVILDAPSAVAKGVDVELHSVGEIPAEIENITDS